MKTNSTYKLIPVLFGFFIMGFVDLVGISTSYVKQDFNLNDKLANLLPLMLFLWFAVLAVPTSMLMSKLGRKFTVILSMGITLVSLIIPVISYSFPAMLVTFSLLGIGNTILQVSLNPLVSNVVQSNRLASSLTLGQFVKAIAAFFGPVIVGFAVSHFSDWKLIFPAFTIVTMLAGVWLLATPIKEVKTIQARSTFNDCFALLKNKFILMLFGGIVFVVGVDVGLNTAIPKFLIDRCQIPLEQAGLGISLYFVARTIGTFAGSILLTRISGRSFFLLSMYIAIPALIIMLFVSQLWLILVLIFVIGLSVANVFSIIFSEALRRLPEHANEISGLLIMGVAGGAILPLIMGMVSDTFGQVAGLSVLLIPLIYLLFAAKKLKK